MVSHVEPLMAQNVLRDKLMEIAFLRFWEAGISHIAR